MAGAIWPAGVEEEGPTAAVDLPPARVAHAVRSGTVQPAGQELHAVSDVDHESAGPWGGIDPAVVPRLDLQAAQVILPARRTTPLASSKRAASSSFIVSFVTLTEYVAASLLGK